MQPAQINQIMKIKILLMYLFLICELPIFAQSGNQQTNKETSAPGLSFSENEYDFGTIKSGSEAVHYFVLTNTGNVPLVILNVRASCGCMASEWPKAPVGTGMKDSLRVEYNTKIKGAFNKTINVQSNAADAMIELRIKGNVVKAK